jgi:hypothetical protein
MKSVKRDLEIREILDIGLQGLLNDERARSLGLFGDTVELAGKFFGKSYRYRRIHSLSPVTYVLQGVQKCLFVKLSYPGFCAGSLALPPSRRFDSLLAGIALSYSDDMRERDASWIH